MDAGGRSLASGRRARRRTLRRIEACAHGRFDEAVRPSSGNRKVLLALRHERWADDEDRPRHPTQQVLRDEHPRFDRLAEPHLVSEEGAAAESPEHPVHRLDLVIEPPNVPRPGQAEELVELVGELEAPAFQRQREILESATRAGQDRALEIPPWPNLPWLWRVPMSGLDLRLPESEAARVWHRPLTRSDASQEAKLPSVFAETMSW
jgi:hypothetical protein